MPTTHNQMTTKDKIWLAVAACSVVGAIAALANGSGTTNRSEKNMNQGKTDARENRDGVTNAVFNLNPLNVKVRLDKAKNITRLYPGDISTAGTTHIMFDSWTNGTAGAMIHLWRYFNGKVTGDAYPARTRLDTIEKIVRTWAPTSDPKNDTEGYIRFVINNLGLFRDAVIPFEEKYIKALVSAMSIQEDRAAAKSLTPDVMAAAWTVATGFINNNRI